MHRQRMDFGGSGKVWWAPRHGLRESKIGSGHRGGGTFEKTFSKKKKQTKKKRDKNIDNNPPSKRAKLLIMRNYDSEEEGTSDYGKTADKQDNSEEETDDVSGDSRHPLTNATNITPI
jgi:hypothetical protein